MLCQRLLVMRCISLCARLFVHRMRVAYSVSCLLIAVVNKAHLV